MIRVAHAPVYTYQLPDGHRFPMQKYELLPQQLLHEGVIAKANFFEPAQVAIDDILLTHSHEYWTKLDTLNLTAKEIRKIGFPLRRDLIERGRYITQGTIDCAKYAMDIGVALNIAGGTHHAFRDRGEGFCLINDIAVAANFLLKNRLVRKILIVDLDVHQGNGTAHIFKDESQVFTFSMHGAKNYPTRKETSDLDIGLADGADDSLYLTTLKNILPGLIEEFRPDLIFYLAGVDVLETDKLGRLSLSKSGCKERDTIVFNNAHKNQIPVAVSMGGGYSPQLRDIIDAHCNTYKAAASVYS